MRTSKKNQAKWWPDPVIAILILIMVGVELFLTATDLGLFGQRGMRRLSYQYAGFWPGLLDDWTPNYSYQSQLMFATYAFLHGGMLHLAANMITLWSLGQAVIDRVGRGAFVLLYLASVLGGALGYAALWTTPQPMVGASGALFGLAGGWLAWEYVDRFSDRSGLWPVIRVALMLIALNVVLFYTMNGQLAWQTHLGGFIAGWVAAMLIDPRPRHIEPTRKDEDGGTT